MKKLTLFLMALLLSITSMAKSSITAIWSIEDGAILEAFENVTITFSGTDPVGRPLDGTSVKEVISATSAVNLLHSVKEDGTTTAIGTLTNTPNGLSVTYSVKDDNGYKLVNNKLIENGNYRIIIPAGVLTFNPQYNDNPVKNDQEFILNFTINNNTNPEEEQQTDTTIVTTMQEIFDALGSKTEVIVLYKNLQPIAKRNGQFYDDYMPDEKTRLKSQYVLPANFDCYGTYTTTDSSFSINSITDIHAFSNLYLLKSYYNLNNTDPNIVKTLNITDSIIVTGVDGVNVFVQYAYARDNAIYYDHLVINGNHTLKVGDQIASFSAKYHNSTSLTLDEENTTLVRNAYFSVEATSLGEITSDNTVKYKALSSINNLENQASNAAQLPSGGIIVKRNTKYFYTIGTDSLELRPTIDIDIEPFVNKKLKLSIRGIVDYCNTADNTKAFIINSIKEINTNYETIAQWLNAAAEGEGEGSLKKPVIVTHSEFRNSKQYIFIGDATGGLCLVGEGNIKIDSIKTGHVLTGIAGKLDFSDTKKTPQISVPSNIQVVDSNKTVEPVEVTIAQLLEEENNALNNGHPAIKYANRLVKIKNVVKSENYIKNNQRLFGLIQSNGTNKDTLAYATNTLNAYNALFSTTTPMCITGIIDFRCINSSNLYSIYPRSIDDLNEQPVITPAPGTYYTEELELAITCEDPAMTGIYYSFDIEEDDPTNNGKLYEGPIKITQDTTIWYAAEYGDRMGKLYEASYKLKEPTVYATWDIEEGATLEAFENVTITFEGVDPEGRLLGKEVTEIQPLTSLDKILYYVEEDGTATAIGILPATKEGLTVTYSVAEDKGYNLVEGKILKNGNYRIVVPIGKLLFNPRRNGTTQVKSDKEYVLNFSIKNDYVEKVEPVQIDAAFTANPADNSSLKEISEVTITFTEKTSVTIGELGATPHADVWPFLNQVTTGSNDEEFGGTITNVSQPVAPMYCEVVENTPNAIRFYIASDLLEGVKSINNAGSYTLTIPAGVVVFNETEINKAITLNYTIEANPIEIDATFTANPADKSTLEEISEIIVTFTDKTSITINKLDTTPHPNAWPFLNQVSTNTNNNKLDSSNNKTSQPVAPMYCEVIENTPNAIRFYIASDLIESGITSINTEGSYTLTIPAGIVIFSETEINKAITLNYTVKEPVGVENITIKNIYTYNGTIMADSDIQIFTITGQNVTNMNGNLQNGVYVVKTANATTKVVIK